MKKQTCSKCNGTGLELNHKQLGKDARKRRNDRGYTLAHAAELMSYHRDFKIHRQYLYQLEHGTKPWNKELIELNTKALKHLS